MPNFSYNNIKSNRRPLLFIKISLIILILLLILSLFIVSFTKKDNKYNFSALKIETKEDKLKKPKLIKPYFESFDKDNNPYNISAEYAEQKNKDLIYMKNLSASLYMNQIIYTIFSEDGEFLVSPQIIHLNKNIKLMSGNGDNFFMQSASIKLKENYIESNSEISGYNNWGSIKAGKFYTRKRGNELVFTKNVKMILNLKN